MKITPPCFAIVMHALPSLRVEMDKNFRHGNGEKWLLGGSVGGLAGGSMIVGLVLVCLRSLSRTVGKNGAATGRLWRV